MIVRTYGRRTRSLAAAQDDDLFLGPSQDSSDVFGDFPAPSHFSSQDQHSTSASWSLDPDDHTPFWPHSDSQPLPSLRLAPPPSNSSSKNLAPTSSLMEAQEFGEMMEHVDEVYFALDGLRPGLPLRVRRSSLLSLLSTCSAPHQRRLLRAQGLAKKVVDAVINIDMDDISSMLASATLLYVLASDGQDVHFLDSNQCIEFLLSLLNIPVLVDSKKEERNLGGNLISLVGRDSCVVNGLCSKVDSSSRMIYSKVTEILVSCKEIKTRNRDDDGVTRPELDSKWISLLTIEKACLSTVSLEDRAATVRRIGGNFKEKFREYGGLDGVFDLAANCQVVIVGCKQKFSSCPEYGKDLLKSLLLLLKCFKIMENAAFLSKENQSHLLDMTAKLDANGLPITFVGLVLSAIKTLSDISLLKSPILKPDEEERPISLKENMDPQAFDDFEIQPSHLHRGEQNGIMTRFSLKNSCLARLECSGKRLMAPKKRRKFFFSQSEYTCSDSAATSTSTSDVYSMNREGNSSASVFSDGKLSNFNSPIFVESGDSKPESVDLCGINNDTDGSRYDDQDDGQDPFAFVDDFEPSKWELLSSKKEVCKTPKARKRREKNFLPKNVCEMEIKMPKVESTAKENAPIRVLSLSSCIDEEDSDLLGDCLLTAVKVLMNLTNDNLEGCHQIASCGGLDIMPSLIIDHFPMFSLIKLGQDKKNLDDMELELLVAILGLLVNLVEKNSQNRSRLSVATVPLPLSEKLEGNDCQVDVIQLLCSIFLANQGDTEATGEGNVLACTDEETIVQGQREAEKMIIEAYAALLLAFLSTESANVRDSIAHCLPDQSLEALVPVLERFVAFHLTLNMISPETHATVMKVIDSCKQA